MSKLRTKLASLKETPSRSRLVTLIASPKSKVSPGDDKLNMTRVFEQTRCKTMTSDGSQVRKESMYTKNIAHFRESFHNQDSHLLPFLASLRNIKDYRKMYFIFKLERCRKM